MYSRSKCKTAMKYRDQRLDIAKGLLIIFVVLGHAIQYSSGEGYTASGLFFYNTVFKTIYAFHMPLFMLISGYLFYNSNKKEIKTLAVSKLKTIGLPMLTFILLCNIPRYFDLILQRNLDGFISLYSKTVAMEMFGKGITMWFLFSILLNTAIVAIITRLIKNKKAQYVTMSIVSVACLFIQSRVLSGVYTSMLPIFYIGYVIKENDIPLYSASNNRLIMIILTLLSIASVFWFDIDTYIYTTGYCIIGDYANQLYIDVKRFIIALIISYTFMQFVHLISSKVSTRMVTGCSKLGQMSLFIYGFNILFDAIYCKVLSDLEINFNFNYIIPILFTVCVIIIATCLYKLLERNKISAMMFLGK